MNKAQLIQAVANQNGTPFSEAEAAVNATLGIIMATVASGEKVTLSGFGVFGKVVRAARAAHNPRTGEPVSVPEKTIPKFNPGAAFKDATKV